MKNEKINKNIMKVKKGFGKENTSRLKKTLSKNCLIKKKNKKKLLFLRFLEVFFCSFHRKIMASDRPGLYRPDFYGICPFFSISKLLFFIFNFLV